MDVYMFGLLSKGSLLSLAGIDFGSQTIKAVTLSGRPGKVHLESVAEIPMPKGTLVDYQLQDIERVGQSLKSLKRLIQGDCQLVATAVTGSLKRQGYALFDDDGRPGVEVDSARAKGAVVYLDERGEAQASVVLQMRGSQRLDREGHR